MTTKKTTTHKKTARKGSKAATLLKSLPDSVENLEIVQQVASVLGELQNRVIDVKEEASRELQKIMKRYETHCKGFEKKIYKVTGDAKKQAQTSMIHIMQKWHEYKDKLPKPLAKEIEKIVEQIGTQVMKKVAPKKPTAKRGRPKKTTVTKKVKVARATKGTKRKAAVASVQEPTVINVL